MKRDGWEQILRDYISQSRSLEFEWGENDCCLWIGRYVDMVTGTEHTKDWHGQYTTEAGAEAFMASRGLPDPTAIADSYLPRKPVNRAGRGDIVSFEGGGLGICAGRYSYFFVEGKGLCALPTLKCLAAWEV
jgi:hypothetical protein